MAEKSSMLKKVKKLYRSQNKTIGQEGDLSMLKEITNHGKTQDCDICLKHSPTTNSLGILQTISISSGNQSNAPMKIQVQLDKGHFFHQMHPEISNGEYTLQDRLINRFPYWRHAELTYVIWYNNVADCWVISHTKDIGTCKWIFAGPIGINKWPNEIYFKGKVLISHPNTDLKFWNQILIVNHQDQV